MKRSELLDLYLDLGGTCVEEIDDVVTWRLALVADGDDVGDLGEGQSGRLPCLDESESIDRGLGVVAVTGRGPGRLVEETAPLIETERLGPDAGASGEFTDEHARLDLPLWWKPYGTSMRIVQILHVPGCHNLDLARRRVQEAINRLGVDIDVLERVVDTETLAADAGMAGSPTILVDGRDVVDPGETGMSLSCRLYRTPTGHEGAPSVDAIVSALSSLVRDG